MTDILNKSHWIVSHEEPNSQTHVLLHVRLGSLDRSSIRVIVVFPLEFAHVEGRDSLVFEHAGV